MDQEDVLALILFVVHIPKPQNKRQQLGQKLARVSDLSLFLLTH